VGAFEQLRTTLAARLSEDDCQLVDTSALPVKHPSRVRGPDGPGQGEELGPGQQFAGHGDDLAPDLVLGEAFRGRVPQPGVLALARKQRERVPQSRPTSAPTTGDHTVGGSVPDQPVDREERDLWRRVAYLLGRGRQLFARESLELLQ
jgi:hypothetical protein